MVSNISKLLQTLWGRKSVRAVELRIPYESDEQMAQVKDDLYQWRTRWQDSIQLSFRPCRRARMYHNDLYIPAKIVVVIASHTALNHLPQGLVITEQQLTPVWNLVAQVKDDTYQCGRVQVTGTKHFKPGEIIYPHARHSGDGYARTYLTGRDRDTNKYITLIGDTHRLEHWRIEVVEDPIVIYELNGFLGWQKVCGENQSEARGIVAYRNQVS